MKNNYFRGRKVFSIRYAPLLDLLLLFSNILLFSSTSTISLVQAQEINSDIFLPFIERGSLLISKEKSPLLSINPHIKFIPASIWKFATASAAFSMLGPEYRFKTEIFQTKNGAIFIKGYGDPFLISEEIDIVAQELQKNVIHPIGDIYLDQSFFSLHDRADGAGVTDNPYDAGNLALVVNFNTINIKKDTYGKIISAEPQTPDLPIMQNFANLAANKPTRINISQKEHDSNRYAVELLYSKIKGDTPNKWDNWNSKRVFQKKVPNKATLIHTHYSSKNLTRIAEEMMLYSNNFIANQVFLTCGAKKYGAPATWEKAQKALEMFLLRDVGLKKESFSIEEGSGLSRKNRISAKAMIDILEHFKPYASIVPKKDDVYIKSGTLTGVYSYAGYLADGKNFFPFVIMLNQEKNTRKKIFDGVKKMILN